MTNENELLKKIIENSNAEITELKRVIRDLAFKHQSEEIKKAQAQADKNISDILKNQSEVKK